jgi:hypothetical protein
VIAHYVDQYLSVYVWNRKWHNSKDEYKVILLTVTNLQQASFIACKSWCWNASDLKVHYRVNCKNPVEGLVERQEKTLDRAVLSLAKWCLVLVCPKSHDRRKDKKNDQKDLADERHHKEGGSQFVAHDTLQKVVNESCIKEVRSVMHFEICVGIIRVRFDHQREKLAMVDQVKQSVKVFYLFTNLCYQSGFWVFPQPRKAWFEYSHAQVW